MASRSSIDQAIEHHINGQLDQALGLYVRALQEDPQTPGAADLISAILRTYLELALALMKTGRNSEAIRSFQRVLAIQPDEPVAHAYLSRLFISDNDRHQATRHLRHYLRLVPEDHIGARLLLAYTGAEAVPERPAPAYITRLYDNYAASYDKVGEQSTYSVGVIRGALQRHRGQIPFLTWAVGACVAAVSSDARASWCDHPQMLAKSTPRVYMSWPCDLYRFLEKRRRGGEREKGEEGEGRGRGGREKRRKGRKGEGGEGRGGGTEKIHCLILSNDLKVCYYTHSTLDYNHTSEPST